MNDHFAISTEKIMDIYSIKPYQIIQDWLDNCLYKKIKFKIIRYFIFYTFYAANKIRLFDTTPPFGLSKHLNVSQRKPPLLTYSIWSQNIKVQSLKFAKYKMLR